MVSMGFDVRKKGLAELLYLYAKGILLLVLLAAVYVLLAVYVIEGLPVLAVALCAAVVTVFCLFYGMLLYRGGRDSFDLVSLQDGIILAQGPGAKNRLDCAEIKFSVELITSSFMSLILITDRDYLVIKISTGYAFFRDGKPVLQGYFQIRDYVRGVSPQHEKVVKSRRSKKHPWIRPPFEMFEWDCRSPRVERYIKTKLLPHAAVRNELSQC